MTHLSQHFYQDYKPRPCMARSTSSVSWCPIHWGKRPTGVTLEGMENPRAWMTCKGGLVMMEYHFRKDRFIAVDAVTSKEWTNETDINQHIIQPN
jgi:hypothetical protein